MRSDHDAQRKLLRESRAPLHMFKNWGFLQPPPQPHGNEAERSPYDEGDSLRPREYLRRSEDQIHADCHQGAEENT
jgi:hypothetical protein